ncbi:MAG: GTP cyclohydrolase I [Candidatus Heimdallarchaeaceae archaeon]
MKKITLTTEAIRQGLKALGVDLNDPNFVDTPKRIATYLSEYISPREEIDSQIRKFTKARFPSTNNEMVIVPGIQASSLCPHHLLPVLYRVSVGYIPKKYVIGLSKIARFVVVMAKYPFLQETYTEVLADALYKELECLGSIVMIKGVHMCMVARGIKQNSAVITSSLKGIFRDNPNAKSEFLSLIRSYEDRRI